MGQRAVRYCRSQSETLSAQRAGGWTTVKLLQISLHYSLAVTVFVSNCMSLTNWTPRKCRVSELMTRYLWGDGGDIQSASAQFVHGPLYYHPSTVQYSIVQGSMVCQTWNYSCRNQRLAVGVIWCNVQKDTVLINCNARLLNQLRLLCRLIVD